MASLTASSLSKQMAFPVKWRTSSATAAGFATAVSGARLPCMMARPARVENGFSKEVMTSGFFGYRLRQEAAFSPMVLPVTVIQSLYKSGFI